MGSNLQRGADTRAAPQLFASGMTFHALGLNHSTAPLALRERFALDESATRVLLRDARLSPEAERVVLSTCNRVEVYLYGTAADALAVKEALAAQAGRPWPVEHAFHFEDEDAVRHLLEVTSGLRSQVLGDTQIFSQVKSAYALAVDEDRVGAIMHRLLHSAFRAAKRVLNETAVGMGSASISQLAVAAVYAHALERGIGLAGGSRVLVLGAGRMGRLAVEALREHEGTRISITNRTASAAREVAEAYDADVVAWEDRHVATAAADATIVCTSAHEPVLTASQLPDRAARAPGLLVDLAVPRNVDASVDVLSGYRVLDLDGLDQVSAPAETRRLAALPAARAICGEAVSEFVAWVFHHQALQPAIQAILHSFESIRRREVDRHHQRFSEVDREQLDLITQSIVQKLLAIPIVRLKSVEPESIDFAQGIRLLHALFTRPGCEHDEVPLDDEGCLLPSMSGDAAPMDERTRALLREVLRSRTPTE